MKKYMFKRILFAIFSLFVVMFVVMLLVYTAIDRNVIFQTDDAWNKKSLNDRSYYEYQQYQKYGYLTYTDFTSWLRTKYQPNYGEEYTKSEEYLAATKAIKNAETYLENADVKQFISEMEGEGYYIDFLERITYKNGKEKPGGKAYLLAVHERSTFQRLIDYIVQLVTVETTDMVQDENLTDRYIRVEKDPYNGLFAVVGSGTQHKYLLYFNSRFPFIHQNFLHLNLGTSYTAYRGQEITKVISEPTGVPDVRRQQYPALVGTDEYAETAIDFHSLTYNASGIVSEADLVNYPDNYTVYGYHKTDLSMLENSFVIGIISVCIAYCLGLPLGILMARRKDKLADKIGNIYIIFIMAVPSLAYIFMFAAVGTSLFNLPYKFANAQIKVLAYVLPTISLALPSIGSLMKWMRRYMIDQMNSDYVKFARAEGLSEQEIYSIHISRNAMIYIVHGIPGSILGCLTGALITETVYAVPGMGRLLTQAINTHDNGVIIACTAFYTTLSILSVILGDLLLAKVDPRISLSEEGGGGR